MSEITANGHNSLVDNRKFPNKSLVIPLKASKRRMTDNWNWNLNRDFNHLLRFITNLLPSPSIHHLQSIHSRTAILPSKFSYSFAQVWLFFRSSSVKVLKYSAALHKSIVRHCTKV